MSKIPKSKNSPKIASKMYKIKEKCDSLQIDFKPILTSCRQYPPWSLNADSVNISLHKLHKNQHNLSQFKTLFHYIQENMPQRRFLFTDGSKKDVVVSYSMDTAELRAMNLRIKPLRMLLIHL